MCSTVCSPLSRASATGWRDRSWAQTAYVRLDGLEGMYGGEARLVSALLHSVPEYLKPRVGLGEGKFPAFVAARVSRPHGATRVPSDAAAFLASHPIDLLPISSAVKTQMHRLGLHAMGQVAYMRRDILADQFGPPGTKAWNLSRGIDDSPLIPLKYEESVVEWTSLPFSSTSKELLLTAVQGKSILDVTKTLNAEGIPTTNGKKWLKTTVHFVLTNEAYAGTVVWGEKAKDGAPPVRVEDAHPCIVSKRDFQKARRLLGSRAPKKVNPRRASSPYLLSGLAKCETCGKAMTAAEAKSGKYTYYICHSLLKRGKGTCKTPRLNAKRFEKIIVDELRANILTESNIRDLVKLLDEEMDGVARDQRERLESIDRELEEVKKQLGRVWHFIAKSDSVDVAEASDLIVELRERKETLEVAAEEARGLLKERRQLLDSADTIATFAEEMSEFLKTSELTETRAFVHSFVKEVQVKPGRATIIYSMPTPDDSPIGGADAAEVALNGRVMNSVLHGGPGRTRTYTLPLLRRMRLPVAPLAHALGCWGDRRESNPCFQDHDLTGCHYTTITTIECWGPRPDSNRRFRLEGATCSPLHHGVLDYRPL